MDNKVVEGKMKSRRSWRNKSRKGKSKFIDFSWMGLVWPRGTRVLNKEIKFVLIPELVGLNRSRNIYIFSA